MALTTTGIEEKPETMPKGTSVVCIDNSKINNFTECEIYTINGHFSYYVVGQANSWDQFITVKNDAGKIVKVNLRRFKVL